ncbi:hypothetical protein CLIB1444_08S05182 [[Candida] jaroonii]|uniref:Uncharacterized protein n=1 Tax=[Candida] jaroonii TaxID=467808 RepID=A0ACA9YB09_9ASCO|nr:hypothetical protein CLIB1444_08S05182 [[Candida] jaroonii]
MEDELITYLFPDINAVRYFQKEFENSEEFHIIEQTKSSGFDIYLVEQWANNRNIGSLISTYTGNLNNEINIIKLTIRKLPSKRYPMRFQEYLNELMVNHAKIKYMNSEETEILFITNITSLPSNLSLIPILNGDYKSIEDNFIINSNLKKLQCSGRSISLITSKISDANEDKFRQMYKIYNLNIPIKFAIKELINLIQTSLFYFDLLDIRYCDGFLCNKTEDAIVTWWNLIGLPHFNIKPPGILPSRTVAAIVSTVLSVKIRLQIFGGCDVPKDPFDVENFMISIGEFQRQVKLDKTRKLDLETFHKLIYITNDKLKLPNIDKKSSYTNEIRKLTSAVKNTVQDRIYDDPKFEYNIETLDLEALVGFLLGKSLKRLWYGSDRHGPINQENSTHHSNGKPLHHHHHHREHIHARSDNASVDHRNHPQKHYDYQDEYKFVSLKDSIRRNQRIHYDKKGLNRMKLGRYNKQKLDLNHQVSHQHLNLTGLSKVDQLLQIEDKFDKQSIAASRDSPSVCDLKDSVVCNVNTELNRRNSFPSNDLNLNKLLNSEYERHQIKRNPSFSLENMDRDSNETFKTVSSKYFSVMSNLQELDKIKNSIQHEKFYSNYTRLNRDLEKLRVNHNLLDNSKTGLLNQDLPNILEFNMSNLSTNLDRLVYESRIIIKRVNDLESECKTLKSKLNDNLLNKLSTTINNLLYSNKFNRVFESSERDELILKLTNNDEEVLDIVKHKDNEIPTTYLRVLITFIWDMIFFILELFKFDRSKMNLDRIRQNWGKLDPNRKYIERAYDFVGYDSKASI